MSAEIKPGDVVQDDLGRAHLLTSPMSVSSSGYGDLWFTSDPVVVVKFWKKSGEGMPDVPTGLPPGWPAAVPYARLVGERRGFIMELIPGMQPFDQFELARTGQHGQVLLILRRVAELLALLHASDLVFGDLHARNFLVSEDGESVVFVDTDTLAPHLKPWRVMRGDVGARLRNSAPPWPGQQCSLFEDDVYRFLRLLLGQREGLLPTYSAWPDKVRRACPLAADLLRPLGGPECVPESAPSMAAVWRAMARDEDRRRNCRFCGALFVDSVRCPRCEGAQPSHAIRITCDQGSSWLEFDEYNPAVLRRRHIRTVASCELDAALGEVTVRHGQAAVHVQARRVPLIRGSRTGVELQAGEFVEVSHE
jgi:hypothetical protein